MILFGAALDVAVVEGLADATGAVDGLGTAEFAGCTEGVADGVD